jgi:hypothetical protein
VSYTPAAIDMTPQRNASVPVALEAGVLVGLVRRVHDHVGGRLVPVLAELGAPHADDGHAPEHELDRQIEPGLLGRAVHELQVDPTAPLDLGHGDDRRGIGRGEEVVEGVRDHLPGPIRQPDLVEVVLRVAHAADALDRELRRAAAAARLAAEADVLVAVPEVDRRRQALGRGRLVLGRVEAARPQVGVVAGNRAAALEVPGHAATRGELLEVLGHAEREHVGAVAVAGDEQAIARPRRLERRRQEQRREGGAGVAEPTEQGVLHPGGVEAEGANGRGVAARVRAVHHEAGEVRGRGVAALEQAAHRLHDVLGVAVLDDEALLPGVHEAIVFGAPDVDDLVGPGVRRLELDRRVDVPDQKGGGAVAPVALERRARRPHAAVARDHEHAARRARGDRVDGGAQGRRPRTQRPAVVGGADVAPQVEGLGDQARGLLLAEGVGRGGEEQAVHAGAVEAAQAVHARADPHRDAVLVVPGDGLLGAAVAPGATGDRAERQPGARNVGTVRDDSGHAATSPEA